MEFKASGEQLIERPVKPSGGGAHVIVPKAWLNRTVLVILKERGGGSAPSIDGSRVWTGGAGGSDNQPKSPRGGGGRLIGPHGVPADGAPAQGSGGTGRAEQP